MSEQDNFSAAKRQPKVTTTRIHVKLKKELKVELEKKAADNFMSLSQLLLQSARQSKIIVKQIQAPELSKEMLLMTAAQNKFGAQLNMLAKHCNVYKDTSDTLKILTALIDIERGIAELRAEILGDL